MCDRGEVTLLWVFISTGRALGFPYREIGWQKGIPKFCRALILESPKWNIELSTPQTWTWIGLLHSRNYLLRMIKFDYRGIFLRFLGRVYMRDSIVMELSWSWGILGECGKDSFCREFNELKDGFFTFLCIIIRLSGNFENHENCVLVRFYAYFGTILIRSHNTRKFERFFWRICRARKDDLVRR